MQEIMADLPFAEQFMTLWEELHEKQTAVAKLVDDAGGNVTRTFSRRLRQSHCQVARQIAVARIARSFYRAFDSEFGAQGREFRQFCQGGFEELCDDRLHYSVGPDLRAGNSTANNRCCRLKQLNGINVDRPANLAGLTLLFVEFR